MRTTNARVCQTNPHVVVLLRLTRGREWLLVSAQTHPPSWRNLGSAELA
jgi:hypothetical protein